MVDSQDGKDRMKSSDELREHLSAYLDGQLSGDLLEQMEATLQDDESLRAELESLRELVAGLSSFPAVTASPDFAARVMAEVGDLDIPASREIGELDEVTPSQPDQQLEPLSVPWWLKGSIVTALAATLVLGYLVVRAPMMTGNAELAGVADQGSPAASWGAPLATGLDNLSDLDGLVVGDAGELAPEPHGAHEDESFGAPQEPPLSKSATPAPDRVRQAKRPAADAVAPAAQPVRTERRRKATGLKEVAADADASASVYEADHEDKAEAVAAVLAPASEPESDGVVALDEEPSLADEGVRAEQPEFAAEDDEAVVSGLLGRSSGAGAQADAEETMPSGLVERKTAVRSSGRSAARRSRAPAATPAAQTGVAAEAAPAEVESAQQLAVVSEEQNGEQGDMPSIAAKVVIGTLVVASPGVISTLASEIQAQQWSLQNLTPMMDPGAAFPATGSQILQIMVPQGAEEDLTALLSGYGTLNTDRVLAAAHDGNARLRLTVRWGN